MPVYSEKEFLAIFSLWYFSFEKGKKKQVIGKAVYKLL